MSVTALIACCCLAAAASLVLFIVAAVQARAVERSSGEDRVHDLRVRLRRLVRVSGLAGGIAAGLCVGLTNWSAASTSGVAVAVVVMLACVALPVTATRRPVVAAYARMRGIPPRALRSSPRQLAMVVLLLAVLAWPAAVALTASRNVAVQVIVVMAGYLAVNPVLIGLLAPVLAWGRGATELPADVQQRLSELAARVGVRVRGRMVTGRARKLANAWQLGWLPGLRYVLLTDYLLDQTTPVQADAVMAHELGHGRHHDVRARQLLTCALTLPFGLMVLAVATQEILVSLAVVVLAAGAVLTARLRGARAIRRELAADDVAAAVVGHEALAGALDRLTELNAIKRDTPMGWDRAVGHPGMTQRIARLRQASGSIARARP